MNGLLTSCAAIVGVLASAAAQAADMPIKAPPLAPVPSWTGFYLGGVVGGGWADRTVTYAGNDPASALLIGGAFGFVGEQPVASHNLSSSGVTGGFELGYNWQLSRNWVAGFEADINGSGIEGSGAGTSFAQNIPPGGIFTQTVNSQQRLDWFGTFRARLGWLWTNDLLLFGTGGLAYGKVSESDAYIFNGPPPGVINFTRGSSFACTVNVTCFSGTTSGTRTGWTAGGGGEWRFLPNWTVKVEYLYVNLGSESVNPVAGAVFTPGVAPSTYKAAFGTDDYHIVRAGVNWHW